MQSPEPSTLGQAQVAELGDHYHPIHPAVPGCGWRRADRTRAGRACLRRGRISGVAPVGATPSALIPRTSSVFRIVDQPPGFLHPSRAHPTSSPLPASMARRRIHCITALLKHHCPGGGTPAVYRSPQTQCLPSRMGRWVSISAEARGKKRQPDQNGGGCGSDKPSGGSGH